MTNIPQFFVQTFHRLSTPKSKSWKKNKKNSPNLHLKHHLTTLKAFFSNRLGESGTEPGSSSEVVWEGLAKVYSSKWAKQKKRLDTGWFLAVLPFRKKTSRKYKPRAFFVPKSWQSSIDALFPLLYAVYRVVGAHINRNGNRRINSDDEGDTRNNNSSNNDNINQKTTTKYPHPFPL